MMTLEDIDAEVDRLRTLAGHGAEAAAAGAAGLRTAVLAEIAGGASDPAAMAQAAIVTVDEDIGGE